MLKTAHYCPYCGDPLKSGWWEGRNRLHCSGCNSIIYENPLPATCVVVSFPPGRILLVKRSVAPKLGQWCLPGGHVDYGETVAQCVVREAYEETGVQVEVERLSGVYSKPYEAREGLTRPSHYVILAFVCRPVGGEIRLSQESVDVRYFAPEALPETLWSWHRARIEDALEGRAAPFIR